MRRFSILPVLLLLAVGALGAQTRAPGTSLRIELGLAYAGYREQTYSAILQNLETASWLVALDIDDGTLLHQVSAGFSMGPTRSAVSDTATLAHYYDAYSGEPVTVALASPITAVKGRLSYGLAAPVADAGAYAGFLGGELGIDALIQIANYPSITAIFALGPLYRQWLTIGPRDRITCDIAAPLVAFAVRPPYAGADAELMRLAATNPLAIFGLGELFSLGRYHGIRADLAYLHQTDSPISLAYSVSASLFRITEPLPRTDAEVDLRAGAAIAF